MWFIHVLVEVWKKIESESDGEWESIVREDEEN
jgi:hypothetical protein